MGGSPFCGRERPMPDDDDLTEELVTAETDRSIALLDEFGLMSEQDLACLLGKNVRTLRNTPVADLPAFTTAGRRRLFYKDSVRQFLEDRKVSATPVRRRFPRSKEGSTAQMP